MNLDKIKTEILEDIRKSIDTSNIIASLRLRVELEMLYLNYSEDAFDANSYNEIVSDFIKIKGSL